jgi:hypothetical protein
MNTTDSKDAVTREQIEQWAQIAGLRGMLHTEANIERLADFAIFARQDFAAALATNPQADGATVPPEVMAALDRMCTPLDASVLSGATASADAHSMQVIHDYVLATARSDAPTDELREDLQEAREILENMVRSIELDGNYSTEATCTFLRQALMCLPTELAATHAPAMAETVRISLLEKALVYVAHSMHSEPQYMLAEGITLGDVSYVRVNVGTLDVSVQIPESVARAIYDTAAQTTARKIAERRDAIAAASGGELGS